MVAAAASQGGRRSSRDRQRPKEIYPLGGRRGRGEEEEGEEEGGEDAGNNGAESESSASPSPPSAAQRAKRKRTSSDTGSGKKGRGAKPGAKQSPQPASSSRRTPGSGAVSPTAADGSGGNETGKVAPAARSGAKRTASPAASASKKGKRAKTATPTTTPESSDDDSDDSEEEVLESVKVKGRAKNGSGGGAKKGKSDAKGATAETAAGKGKGAVAAAAAKKKAGAGATKAPKSSSSSSTATTTTTTAATSKGGGRGKGGGGGGSSSGGGGGRREVRGGAGGGSNASQNTLFQACLRSSALETEVSEWASVYSRHRPAALQELFGFLMACMGATKDHTPAEAVRAAAAALEEMDEDEEENEAQARARAAARTTTTGTTGAPTFSDLSTEEWTELFEAVYDDIGGGDEEEDEDEGPTLGAAGGKKSKKPAKGGAAKEVPRLKVLGKKPSKAEKALLDNFREVWRRIAVASKRSAGFDKRLLEDVVAMLTVVNARKHGLTRWMATVAAHELGTALATERAAQEAATAKQGRQLSSTKHRGALDKVKAVELSVHKSEKAKAVLDEALTGLKNGVLVHRLTDSRPEIRAEAIDGLRGWMLAQPSQFVKRGYTGYMGRALSDKDAGVRKEAVKAVHALLADSTALTCLLESRFMESYCPRLVEMKTDADGPLVGDVFRCLRKAIDVGAASEHITEEQESAMEDAIFDGSLPLASRAQALAYYINRLEVFDKKHSDGGGLSEEDEDEDEDGGDKVGGGGKGRKGAKGGAAKGGAAAKEGAKGKKGGKGQANSTSSTSGAGSGSAKDEIWASQQVDELLSLAGVHANDPEAAEGTNRAAAKRNVECLVEALWSLKEGGVGGGHGTHGAVLRYWAAYFTLLCRDSEHELAVSNMEVEILVEFMKLTAKHLEKEAASTSNAPGAKKLREEARQSLARLTDGILEHVPELLRQSAADEERLPLLLSLLQHMVPERTADSKHKARFSLLLKGVKEVFCQATSGPTLEAAAVGLQALASAGHGRKEEVDRVVGDVMLSVANKVKAACSLVVPEGGGRESGDEEAEDEDGGVGGKKTKRRRRGSNRSSSRGSSRSSNGGSSRVLNEQTAADVGIGGPDEQYALGLALRRMRHAVQHLDPTDSVDVEALCQDLAGAVRAYADLDVLAKAGADEAEAEAEARSGGSHASAADVTRGREDGMQRAKVVLEEGLYSLFFVAVWLMYEPFVALRDLGEEQRRKRAENAEEKATLAIEKEGDEEDEKKAREAGAARTEVGDGEQTQEQREEMEKLLDELSPRLSAAETVRDELSETIRCMLRMNLKTVEQDSIDADEEGGIIREDLTDAEASLVNEARGWGFSVGHEMAATFKPALGDVEGLHRLAWRPSGDLANIMRKYFKEQDEKLLTLEEDGHESDGDETATATAGDDDEERDEALLAKEARSRHILRPFMKSLISNVSTLHRHMTAEVLSHCLSSKAASAGMLKSIFSSKLLEGSFRVFMEVQMATLVVTWRKLGKEAYDEEDDDDDGNDGSDEEDARTAAAREDAIGGWLELVEDLSDTLQASDITSDRAQSFMRFMLEGVRYAVQSGDPEKFGFLKGMQCYLDKSPPHLVRPVATKLREFLSRYDGETAENYALYSRVARRENARQQQKGGGKKKGRRGGKRKGKKGRKRKKGGGDDEDTDTEDEGEDDEEGVVVPATWQHLLDFEAAVDEVMGQQPPVRAAKGAKGGAMRTPPAQSRGEAGKRAASNGSKSPKTTEEGARKRGGGGKSASKNGTTSSSSSSSSKSKSKSKTKSKSKEYSYSSDEEEGEDGGGGDEEEEERRSRPSPLSSSGGTGAKRKRRKSYDSSDDGESIDGGGGSGGPGSRLAAGGSGSGKALRRAVGTVGKEDSRLSVASSTLFSVREMEEGGGEGEGDDTGADEEEGGDEQGEGEGTGKKLVYGGGRRGGGAKKGKKEGKREATDDDEDDGDDEEELGSGDEGLYDDI